MLFYRHSPLVKSLTSKPLPIPSKFLWAIHSNTKLLSLYAIREHSQNHQKQQFSRQTLNLLRTLQPEGNVWYDLARAQAYIGLEEHKKWLERKKENRMYCAYLESLRRKDQEYERCVRDLIKNSSWDFLDWYMLLDRGCTQQVFRAFMENPNPNRNFQEIPEDLLPRFKHLLTIYEKSVKSEYLETFLGKNPKIATPEQKISMFAYEVKEFWKKNGVERVAANPQQVLDGVVGMLEEMVGLLKTKELPSDQTYPELYCTLYDLSRSMDMIPKITKNPLKKTDLSLKLNALKVLNKIKTEPFNTSHMTKDLLQALADKQYQKSPQQIKGMLRVISKDFTHILPNQNQLPIKLLKMIISINMKNLDCSTILKKWLTLLPFFPLKPSLKLLSGLHKQSDILFPHLKVLQTHTATLLSSQPISLSDYVTHYRIIRKMKVSPEIVETDGLVRVCDAVLAAGRIDPQMFEQIEKKDKVLSEVVMNLSNK